MAQEILVGLGGIAAGITATIVALAWVFPTKDRVAEQSKACRQEIYAKLDELEAKLNEKADNVDLKELQIRINQRFDLLASQINEINKNIVELMTTIKLTQQASKRR